MSSVPVTGARHRIRSRPRRRSLVSSQSTSRITTFLAIVGVTYLVSSLSGQVMVEKARREGIRASGRAIEARKVEAELSKRLDMLTSFASVDEWAKTHNFLPPDQLAANPETAAPLGVVPALTASEKPEQAAPAAVEKGKKHKKAKAAADEPLKLDQPLADQMSPTPKAPDLATPDDGIRHNGTQLDLLDTPAAPDPAADTADEKPAPKHHHRKRKSKPKVEAPNVQAR